jgi:MFS superfamily sulfate permease-like transporter
MTIKPQPLTFRFLGMTFNVPTFFDWAAALFAGAVVLVLLSWLKPTPLIPANYTVVIVASVLSACGVSLLNWRNWKHILFFVGAILSVGFITQVVWPHF